MKTERIDRVRTALRAAGLTQMIVCDPKSIWYLTGVCVAPYERLLAQTPVSKSWFLRLFRQYMGTTPYNYLVNFRITQAKELLVLTDHSVTEIAQQVGFGDASNFSTRFAKATGQSPLQYRKSALKPLDFTREAGGFMSK